MKEVMTTPETAKTTTASTTKATNYLIDHQILSELEVLEELGKGSFGSVYKTSLNGKTVAMKVIDVENGGIAEAENEKEIMKRLTEAHVSYVVQLIAYTLYDNSYFIAMEYMEKGSLGNFIKNNPQPLDWSLRYLWIQEITRGLSFLHDCLIVHRDIKGANILLDKDMHVKIGDFGASTIMEKGKPLTELIGTPVWIAPEIVKGKPYDEKIDIYSLAVTLWEIASWKYPEVMTNLFDTLNKTAQGIRPEIDSNCKPKIAKLITWGWRAKPEQRPSTKELLTELDSDIDVMSAKISEIDIESERAALLTL